MTNSNQSIAHSLVQPAGSKREWTLGMLEAGARSRGTTPRGRLLAIFEVLDDLINRADREARSFIESLASVDSDDAGLRDVIGNLVDETASADPEELRQSWFVLVAGCVRRAVDGDLDAARRARQMAADVVTRLGGVRIVAVPAAADADFSFDFDVHFDSVGTLTADASAFNEVGEL